MPEHKPRGFALLPKDKLLRVAASGGKVAHSLGLAHKFTSVEAASAGRLGGNSVSKNREHMSRIGKAGGKNRAARAKLTAEEYRLLQQLLLTLKGVRAVAVRRQRAAEANDIGSLIRRLRQEGGLTRRALSEQTNLAETTIRELELGRLTPTRELLAGLLRSPVMAALLKQARAVGVLELLQ